jgi:hypothetical protein
MSSSSLSGECGYTELTNPCLQLPYEYRPVKITNKIKRVVKTVNR